MFFCGMFSGCTEELPVTEIVTENTAQVSGVVTVQGRALTSGNLVLYSLANGNTVQVPLNNKGEFTVAEQIPAVEYNVYFTESNGMPHSGVPVKYQSDASTDYTISVTPGPNQLEIKIP